jgi:hypothetical protein
MDSDEGGYDVELESDDEDRVEDDLLDALEADAVGDDSDGDDVSGWTGLFRAPT